MLLKAKFEFGDVVMDTYSGYQGQVTAVCFYKTGCVQYCVNAKKMKDKKPLDGEWLDGSRLKPRQKRQRRTPELNVVLTEEKILARIDEEEATEGPQQNPPAAD